MGKDVVRFRCHHCNHCCTDVVCLPTPWDVIRIVRETEILPHAFLEFLRPDEIAEVPKNDPTWLTVDGKRYIMAVRRGRNGCYFLDPASRMCRIYAIRPMLCRLFPFKLRQSRAGEFKGFGLHSDVECPRERDGIVETAALYALYEEDARHQEDYRALVSVFNRRKYAGKKPEDFIQMFVEVIPAKKKWPQSFS